MDTLAYFVIGVSSGLIFKASKTWTRFSIYTTMMVILVIITHYK